MHSAINTLCKKDLNSYFYHVDEDGDNNDDVTTMIRRRITYGCILNLSATTVSTYNIENISEQNKKSSCLQELTSIAKSSRSLVAA